MNVKAIQASKQQHEFWRKLYIKLITEDFEEWGDISDDERSLRMFGIKDLVDAKFLDGDVVEDAAGMPRLATGIRSTLAGRIFAEEQQDILNKNSFWGRAKAGSSLFIGWLGGIISAIIIWRLTK